MKLKAYFNEAARIVEIRLAGDAAPAAPFTLLGDIIHETPGDNASGMQGVHLSHVVKQHVDELLYTKLGIQSTQLIKINYAGGVKPLKSFSIDCGRNTLKAGLENTITVRLEPAGATLARPLTIVPTNPELVEIVSNANGVLKYKGKTMGDLFFHVQVENHFQQIPVRIETNVPPYTAPIPVTSIKVTPATAALDVGQSRQLAIEFTPSNATDKTVTYTSSDVTKLTVDANGLCKAVAAGTAMVTCKPVDGAPVATATFTTQVPVVPVTGVSLNKTTLSLKIGATETLTANITPANASDKKVAWASSDPAVATVNATTGLITGVTEGVATITCTTNNGAKKATCEVTITAV